MLFLYCALLPANLMNSGAATILFPPKIPEIQITVFPSLLHLLPSQKSSIGPTSAAYLLYFGTVQTALLPSPSFGGEEKDKAAQNQNAMPRKYQ